MSKSIAELLSWARHYLATDSARLDAEILLSFTMNKPHSYLLTWPDEIVKDDHRQAFEVNVEKRKLNYPIAYLLGEQEFWSLPFSVSAATLIPRPETELLVEEVLNQYSVDSKVVVDAGTGSGVIAITLKKERPRWQLIALDVSAEALVVAKHNAKRHNANVACVQSSWLACMASCSVDVIVTNPPYIEEGDEHLAALTFEPKTALVAKDSGLADIKEIVNSAKRVLKLDGKIFIEHGYNQGEAVRTLLASHGFKDIATVRDYAACERFTYAEVSNNE